MGLDSGQKSDLPVGPGELQVPSFLLATLCPPARLACVLLLGYPHIWASPRGNTEALPLSLHIPQSHLPPRPVLVPRSLLLQEPFLSTQSPGGSSCTHVSPECLPHRRYFIYKLPSFMLSCFGRLLWRTDSFEKTLMPEKIEGRRRSRRQRMRWLDGITDSVDMSE